MWLQRRGRFFELIRRSIAKSKSTINRGALSNQFRKLLELTR